VEKEEVRDDTHTSPWFVVPPPWDNSAAHVTSASEDPHSGEFICFTDEGRWNDHSPDDVLRWQANAALIAAAPTAPHECDIPGCPGVENKRKLDAFDDLLASLKDARDAIASLPPDTLGYARDGLIGWPIKVELLTNINANIAKARGEPE